MNSDAIWRRRGLAVGALACALALAACADFSRGEPSPAMADAGGPPATGDAATADGAAGDGAAASFATGVYPLLVPTCQMCHATGQQAGDTQLLFTGDAATDYATVGRCSSTPPRRQASRLLAKMTGNGHQGGTVYAAGSPEYQTILQWIQQGAQP